MSTVKCGRNGCYTRVPAGELACPPHRALISPATVERIRAAAEQRAWGAHSIAVRQAVDELNAAPRPAEVTNYDLDQLWKMGALT